MAELRPSSPIRFIAAAALVMAAAASAGRADVAGRADTIRVWKVGSPHVGDTPKAVVPPALAQELSQRGVDIEIETFPARGFAATFVDAAKRGEAPDLLVLDNMGVMTGITTALGRFDGVATDPTYEQHFVQVTGAFDALLGPQRGWTYLFALSTNHALARTVALRAPRCADRRTSSVSDHELAEMVPKLATAYLLADAGGLQDAVDPDALRTVDTRRLTTGSPLTTSGPIRSVARAQACGIYGNERLAFALVSATYEKDAALGETTVLLVLRRPASQWQLLAAARDPVSTGTFAKEIAPVAASLANDSMRVALPLAATRLSPEAGLPKPRGSEHFGTFTWQASASDEVVAEVAGFAYKGDARLFVIPAARRGGHRDVSAGKLWTADTTWIWRIWSISRSGDVVFSETRSFEQ